MKNWLSTQMLNLAPIWLGVPLGGLGAFFIVMKPLGFPLNWTIYAGCLILAIVAGAVTHRYYEMSVVESNRNSVTFQVGRRLQTVADPTDPRSVRRSSALWGLAFGVVCASVWFALAAELTRLPGTAAGWGLAALLISTAVAPIVYAAHRLLPSGQVLRQEVER
jgi:hypothetical protein